MIDWSLFGVTLTIVGIVLGNIYSLFKFTNGITQRLTVVETKVDDISEDIKKVNNVRTDISDLNSRVCVTEDRLNIGDGRYK